jgi:hypothetical protein
MDGMKVPTPMLSRLFPLLHGKVKCAKGGAGLSTFYSSEHTVCECPSLAIGWLKSQMDQKGPGELSVHIMETLSHFQGHK